MRSGAVEKYVEVVVFPDATRGLVALTKCVLLSELCHNRYGIIIMHRAQTTTHPPTLSHSLSSLSLSRTGHQYPAVWEPLTRAICHIDVEIFSRVIES